MKQLFFIISCMLLANALNAQDLSLYKEDISPDGIRKIGGISIYNDQVYLLLQSNILFNGKEIEASEAIAISQKYPVWDIYRYDPLTGSIENHSEQWKTTGATSNGFCIVDESTVIYINDKNHFDSNNSELKKTLNKLQNRKVAFADPSMNTDKNKLWFSADQPGGEGGMDIWYSEKKGDEWSDPINAGKGINTAENEISPSVYKDSILIFSSNLEGKNYDLCFFDLKKGKMLHRETMPESNEFFTSLTHKGNLYFLSKTGSDTKLWKSKWSEARTPELKTIEAPKIEKVIEAPKPENDLVLKTPEAKPEDKLNIQMTNYFGLARYELTPYMKDSLNRLAQTLKRSSDLNILICGHASPDGPENLNMMLSYYRASEAYNWLISHGIDDSRIYRVYGGEYLFVGTEKARNFSIFTFRNPELPRQIALYPLAPGEKEEEVVSKFGANSDDMTFHRYQLNKFLPLENKKLLLIPVNVLYFAKTGEKASDIARQYNIPPTRLKQMNRIGDEALTEDKVLFIVY
ncbi:MAG: OmpA family protein [Prolixibacteraceae bacterium]|nr:OmpA family protein [Prolixibacteraceae bacterium]